MSGAQVTRLLIYVPLNKWRTTKKNVFGFYMQLSCPWTSLLLCKQNKMYKSNPFMATGNIWCRIKQVTLRYTGLLLFNKTMIFLFYIHLFSLSALSFNVYKKDTHNPLSYTHWEHKVCKCVITYRWNSGISKWHLDVNISTHADTWVMDG